MVRGLKARFDESFDEWADRHWLVAGLLGVAVLAPGVVFLAVFLYWPMASNAVRAIIDEPLFFAILVILGLVGLLDHLRHEQRSEAWMPIPRRVSRQSGLGEFMETVLVAFSWVWVIVIVAVTLYLAATAVFS